MNFMTGREERERVVQYVCALLSREALHSKEFFTEVTVPKLFDMAEIMLEEERKRYD